MDVINKHPDVLYVIESFINAAAAANSTIVDYHVLDGLEAARRTFLSRIEGKAFHPGRMDERAREIFLGVTAAGALLLGKPAPELDLGEGNLPDAVPLEVLVACIRRIEKSVKTWNEQNGRRGYIEYISAFLPGA